MQHDPHSTRTERGEVESYQMWYSCYQGHYFFTRNTWKGAALDTKGDTFWEW